jgi:hypothetical protein
MTQARLIGENEASIPGNGRLDQSFLKSRANLLDLLGGGFCWRFDFLAAGGPGFAEVSAVGWAISWSLSPEIFGVIGWLAVLQSSIWLPR